MKFVAISNISELGLKKIFDLNLQGIPCPSIQIKPFEDITQFSKDDSLFSFGEISFIFEKEHIFYNYSKIPKNNATYEIFNGDGYTLRFPDLKYSIYKPNLTSLKNEIVSLINGLEDFPMDDYFNKIQSIKTREYFIDKSIDSITMKLLFLKDYYYIDKFKPIFSTKEHTGTFKSNPDLQELLKDISRESIQNDPEKYISYINNKIKYGSEHDKMIFNLFIENEKIKPLLLLTLFKQDIDLIKNPKTKYYENEQTKILVNKLVQEVETKHNLSFIHYLHNIALQIYTDPKIADNNKKADIDNIVSYMKRNRGLGTEQSNFLGINRFLAQQKDRIYSVSELEEYSHFITDIDGKNRQDEKIRKLFYELSNITNYSHEKLIERLIDTRNSCSDKTIIKSFDDINFNENPHILKKIQEFIMEAKDCKHLYFEAKINQAFYFPSYPYGNSYNKLNIVIVPDNISNELLIKLEKHKFTIIKYDHTDYKSRLEAIKSCEELFINTNIQKPKQKNKIL